MDCLNFIFQELLLTHRLFLFYSILCLFYRYSICSFCLVISSNIFQVFLRALQFLIFLCDLSTWCLSWSVSFRQEALLSVGWPLPSVLFDGGGGGCRLDWGLMLGGLALLTGDLHCQVIRGLIKQVTDGIIWRLSLWGLKFPQSRILQLNWLPAFWKQDREGVQGFHH